MNENFGNSYIERAWEPPEEVVMQRSMVETRGMQPEDVGVLAALLLRDPGRPATAKAMAADLRDLGWKMSLDRFEKVVGRLSAAGHMHRDSVFNQKTGRPEWVSRVYRNPANNAGYVSRGSEAASQVSGGIGENPIPGCDDVSELGENPIPPGQSELGENPIPGANSGKTRFRDQPVSAGQSRNREKPDSALPPPHPPEEVTTSSPSPLTDTSGRTSLPSPREEGEAGYAEEDLRAAADVLQLLPDPWTQGRLNASKLAPKLLGVMAEQGWPGIHTVDRALLTRQLTKNPHKITNPYRLLAGDRIPNLPRYVVVAVASEPAPGSTPDGMCLKHPQYRAGSRCIPCVSA
ncbi:hypothetical protein ACFQ6O_43860 [Streptomyces sp. NPDC056441]|uniref:hypothetical protein n=1 Tax=Streptomyces sp. NPDC056441 TaxID=3345817 RepID=UPI003676677A